MSELSGEWWIDAFGNATFADGDVGDTNHERAAFMAAVGVDLEEEYSDLDWDVSGRPPYKQLAEMYLKETFGDEIKFYTLEAGEEIEHEISADLAGISTLHDDCVNELYHPGGCARWNALVKRLDQEVTFQDKDPDPDIIETTLAHAQLESMGADMEFVKWLESSSQADSREYALEHMGWIRIHGDNFELWDLDDKKLRTIQRADFWEKAADDPEKIQFSKETLLIEDRKTGETFEVRFVDFFEAKNILDLKVFASRLARGDPESGFSVNPGEAPEEDDEMYSAVGPSMKGVLFQDGNVLAWRVNKQGSPEHDSVMEFRRIDPNGVVATLAHTSEAMYVSTPYELGSTGIDAALGAFTGSGIRAKKLFMDTDSGPWEGTLDSYRRLAYSKPDPDDYDFGAEDEQYTRDLEIWRKKAQEAPDTHAEFLDRLAGHAEYTNPGSRHRHTADQFRRWLDTNQIKHRINDTGDSVYFIVEVPSDDPDYPDSVSVRFADHAQPAYGGYSLERGERHGSSELSVDPDSEVSYQGVKQFIRDRYWLRKNPDETGPEKLDRLARAVAEALDAGDRPRAEELANEVLTLPGIKYWEQLAFGDKVRASRQGGRARNPGSDDLEDFDYEFAWNPGAEEYLAKLGASQDVIEFIKGQEDTKLQGKLVNLVRKDPGVTLEALESFLGELPGKRENTEAEEREIRGVMRDNFNASEPEKREKMWAWFRVQYIKHRVKAPQRHDKLGFVYRFPVARQVVEFSLPPSGGMDAAPLADFYDTVSEMRDWINSEHPEIASYSWEDALEATRAWHETCALTGAGEKYLEGTKNVIYEYSDSWTIRKIVTENDLTVEGNRMGHCVGSYWRKVQSGETEIYSLRDTKNEPHVTFEARPQDDETKQIQQIQGKQDREPIQEYKDRLKEFFQVAKVFEADFDEGNPNVDMEELAEAIHNRYFGFDKDYGLKSGVNWLSVDLKDLFDTFKDAYKSAVRQWREPWYQHFMDDGAEVLVKIAARIDEEYRKIGKLRFKYPRPKNEAQKTITSDAVSDLWDLVADGESELWDRMSDNYQGASEQDLKQAGMEPEPDPEDYEQGEEDQMYQEDLKKHEVSKEAAEEKFQQESQDYEYEEAKKYFPWGWYQEIANQLNEQAEKSKKSELPVGAQA